MKKAIWIIIIIIVLAWLAISFSGNDSTELNGENMEENGEMMENGDAMENEGAMMEGVREFTVSGENFSFTPSALSVKKGETVRITFKDVEGFHDFVIDEFNVATTQINAGSEEVVEFVASEAGTFEFYCSVGEHRAMGMVGVLTVEE